MADKPRVSVIIPTYNRASTVGDAIKSVLNQTYSNIECIVVDDGSLDDTGQVLSQFSGQITLITSVNRGVSSARNLGMRAARGDYIAFLDSDDFYLPDKLDLQVTFLESHPNVEMVSSDMSAMRDGEIFEDSHFVNYMSPYLQEYGLSIENIYSAHFKFQHGGEEIDAYMGNIFKPMLHCPVVISTTALFRRVILEVVGYQDESISLAEDYDFMVRICKHHIVAYLDRPLYVYRYGHDQLSMLGTGRTAERMRTTALSFQNFLRVTVNHGEQDADFFAENRAWLNPLLSSKYSELGRKWIGLGDSKHARACFSKAHDYVPSDETFFRKMLGDVDEPTAPFGLADVQGDGTGIGEASSPVEPSLARRLRERARALGVSPADVFHVAWAQVLARVSARDDVVFGTVLVGRMQADEGPDRVGEPFTNILPLRICVGEESVQASVQHTQALLAQLLSHVHAPLALAQRCSAVAASTPLFGALLNYRDSNTLAQRSTEANQTKAGTEFLTSEERINYPFVLSVDDLGEGFALTAAVRSPADPQRICAYMHTALDRFVGALESAPATSLRSLDVLPEAERHQLLVEWNDTGSSIRADQCIHQLFEAQVKQTPEAVALEFNGHVLTYRHLNSRANQLARHLRELGVAPEVCVGVYMERGLDMVISLLGILKAGGAYVPLDPAYPRSRVAFMLQDCQSPLVLTQQRLLESLPASAAKVVCVDTELPRLGEALDDDLTRTAGPTSLAYVIYTSGSTGTPKGVAIEHQSTVTFIRWALAVFAPEELSGVLASTSICFDLSVYELFVPLSSGGRVILVENAMELSSLSAEARVTLVNTVPSAIAELLRRGAIPDSVVTVNLAGEPLSPELADAIYRQTRAKQVYDLYGPSEATTYSTYTLRLPEGPATIGRPIAGTQAYVLDRHGQLVPVGVPGELFLGGAGLARGYLNRPELTAEKFIANPIAGAPSARLYRTGDLVRHRPNGNLEYLGRMDHQVKIRGFRIELGEVESCLRRHPAVKDVAVVAQAGASGDKRLVAYLVAGDGEAPTIADLRSYLKRDLPEYMVPSAFMTLKVLPLTPNGKVDRRALPAPEHSDLQQTAYVAPRTPIEEALTGIWTEVLGLDRVGIHDNFFELGGHSLLAMQVVSRVRTVLQAEVPLPVFFEGPTVAQLAQHSGAIAAASPIPRIPREGGLPLSFAQQRLWFIDQLEPGSSMYNIPLALRLTGPLDMAIFERSLSEVVRRHEVLRTTFRTLGGEPIQRICAAMPLRVPVTDLSGLPEAETEGQIRRLLAEEARRPFDLSQDLMLRAGLLRLDSQEHVCFLTLHHIAADGWSVGVLFRELTALYAAFSRDPECRVPRPSPLTDLPIQYADFTIWQRKWLQGNVLEAQLAYWKRRLEGAPPVLELPMDHSRPAVQTYRGAQERFVLDKGLSEALRLLSRQEKATLFMTLLATFQTLLYRYSGQEDFVVGSPIAGRNRLETEQLIGFFVNTLALRADVSGNPTFRKLLARVREATLGAYAHQDLPFEKLVDEMNPQRNLSYAPLVQVVFMLQNDPAEPLRIPGLTVSSEAVENNTAKFDLTLSMTADSEGLRGVLEYNTDLFERGTIQRMLRHFQTLLEGVTADPGQRIGELPLLTEAERHQLLVEWNDTGTDYPRERCVHELFEEQVERTPEAAALVFGDQRLSYCELNSRANQLAHYLRRLGVGPDDLVAVYMDRSLDLVVALLGILKAGGAYLPMDLAYPPDRLAFMLQDSDAKVLITQKDLCEQLPRHAAEVICLDRDGQHLGGESATNPSCATTPDNLAYVIYTSGSTGRPKGVLITHSNVARLFGETEAWFHFGPSDVWTLFHSYAFDFSVWELWGGLLYGGCVVVVPYWTSRSPEEFYELLCREQVTILNQTPPAFSQLIAVEEKAGKDDRLALRLVIFGGEALNVQAIKPWFDVHGDQHPQMVNMYGITETTVHVTYYPLSCADLERPACSPIGRAIDDLRLYVLDAYGNLSPVGVPGELCVGGRGLARGYLNRPELTAERFVHDPFSDAPGARLYKTGDLVRWLPDGTLEFLGRLDRQVKIRGFRIELGEIESCLRRHPAIRDVAVVAREDSPGDKRLVAYVVAKDGEAPTVADLRSHLKQELPEFMIPAAFMTLKALPLTPNGKVDRRALPVPEAGRPEMEHAYTAPRTPLEQMLTGIWAEVLGLEHVGIHDNFFELGGHSLLATQVVSRVLDLLRVQLPLRRLFESPTVAGLAEATFACLLEADAKAGALTTALREERT